MRLLLHVVSVLGGVHAVFDSMRVKDNIHIPLTSTRHHCMRLLNGTHQFGCESKRDGNVGVVAEVRRPDDIDKHIANLPWGLNSLIALVAANDLTKELLTKINREECVEGVLLVRDRSRPFEGFSEDGFSPNKEFSYYGDQTLDWNAESAQSGEGFLRTAFDKPIFYIHNATEVDLLYRHCYHGFNDQHSTGRERCVARMQAFMLAAGDARLCQARESGMSLTSGNTQLCDPMSDFNVVSLIPALDARTSKADVFVLATRLDSASIITDSAGGDVSVLVSLIAALSAARAIGDQRLELERVANKTRRQCLFAFFHGESLGYVGSSRFVFDLERNARNHTATPKPEKHAKPLHMDDIRMVLELQQFSYNNNVTRLHADPDVAKQFRTQLGQITAALQRSAERLGHRIDILFDEPGAQLPPASIHSFLKSRPLASLLLAPFRAAYTARTINSFFDTQLLENPHRREPVITEVTNAATLARDAILEFVGNGELKPEQFALDQQYIADLVDCLIFDPYWNCTLISTLTNNTDHITPHNTYIEISGYSTIRQIVTALLIDSLGDKRAALNVRHQTECLAKNKDQDLFVFFWQKDRKTDDFVCYKTSVYTTPARSPAFLIADYDLADTRYSTFMESRWEMVQLELYLMNGFELELRALGLAVGVLAIAGLVLAFLREDWFKDPSEVTPAAV